MELDYESDRKPKLNLTCEINLKKDMFVDMGKTFEIFDMVKNFDWHILFGVIDKEEFVSESLYMNKGMHEHIRGMDNSIENFCGENYLQKEMHELLFGNYVEDYRGY